MINYRFLHSVSFVPIMDLLFENAKWQTYFFEQSLLVLIFVGDCALCR